MSTSQTLLVVDDEPAIRLLLSEFFKKRCRVVAVDGGRKSLEWLNENSLPCAMIVDLNMPDMGGIEVIKQIRAQSALDGLPIIVLSSKESSQDRIQCLRAGADDYLVKPFNPEELDARLESILRRVGHTQAAAPNII